MTQYSTAAEPYTDALGKFRFQAFFRDNPNLKREYPSGRLQDIVDRIYSDTRHIVCRDDKGEIVGSVRYNDTYPLPFTRFWEKIGENADMNSAELSRLTLHPKLANPATRLRIIQCLLSSVTELVGDRGVYTTSRTELITYYAKLAGFKKVSPEGKIVPPGDDLVYLLYAER